MLEVSTYLNWLVREQANQSVNVFCKTMSGTNKGDTFVKVGDGINYVSANDGNYSAIWATIHALKPSALGKVKVAKADVSAYRYLCIDIDSKVAHSRGVCATDDERGTTQIKANAIDAMLQKYGLPRPLKVMSGNGSLLLFPIDLPYTVESYAMMSQLGESLARLFNDDACDIDEAVVKDPARVLGIVGTINRSKTEIESEGRLAKVRAVIGEYPKNDPISADAFRTAISTLIVEHKPTVLAVSTVSFDESDTLNTVGDSKTITTIATLGKRQGWDAIETEDRWKRCKAYIAKCKDAIEGNGGHDATFTAACECYRFGLSHEQAIRMMNFYNSTKCRPCWTDDEISHKLHDAYNAVLAEGEFGDRVKHSNDSTGTVSTDENETTKPTATTDYAMTDLGNAEHFASVYGDELKYIVAWKAWLIYDGKRWIRDNTDKVGRLAQKHVKHNMPKYATTIKDDERRTRYLKWASQSQSQGKVDAMVAMAATKLGCGPEILDANHNLFNVSNGTIEIDTLKFRPHDRRDMLTKISSAKYDPTAVAPTWDAFVSRIFQDCDGKPRAEVIEYVKRAVGYSITADVSAQCFFVLHGRGKNGKTTFVDAVKNVMGDYAKNGMQSLLMSQGEGNGNRNTDDEADLFGMRLVAVSETDEGIRFNASKVKRLVDTSNIRAMRKFEHSFEFAPTHKLWLCCNHMPKVDGNDDAMKRRLKKIPFMVQIPPEERDEHLGEKLANESSGILNWMLDGLKQWQADGRRLSEPQEIAEAVGEYFQSNDTFGSFLSERIEPNDITKVSVAQAYAAYCEWAEDNGLNYKLTKLEFGKRMGERGYPSKPYRGGRCYVGCSLKEYVAIETTETDTAYATDDRPF